MRTAVNRGLDAIKLVRENILVKIESEWIIETPSPYEIHIMNRTEKQLSRDC